MQRQDNQEIGHTSHENWGRNAGRMTAAASFMITTPFMLGGMMTLRRGSKVDAALQITALSLVIGSAYGVGSLAGKTAASVANGMENVLRAQYQRIRSSLKGNVANVEHIQVQQSLQQDAVEEKVLAKRHQ